tara:strand:+ start:102 stop:221 length:120 start_codon:yes stop_codon:yes gene_type:complete
MEKEIKNPLTPNIQFELGIVKVGGDAVKVEEPEEENKDK